CIDGVARHVVIAPAGPETAPQEGVVVAGDIAAAVTPAYDDRTIEAAAVPAAVPGVAKARRGHHALAALVDPIIHMDDEIGLFTRRGRAITVAGQFACDEIGILAEFDPALEGGVARLDGEALALRGRKLRLEARDVG